MIAGIAAAAAGLWLMAAPGLIGYDDPAASSHHILGPLVTSFAVIGVWETTREVRRLNLLLAPVLALTPALDMPAAAVLSTLASAAVIAALALLPAPLKGRYGGGWRELLDWRRQGEAGGTLQ